MTKARGSPHGFQTRKDSVYVDYEDEEGQEHGDTLRTDLQLCAIAFPVVLYHVAGIAATRVACLANDTCAAARNGRGTGDSQCSVGDCAM